AAVSRADKCSAARLVPSRPLCSHYLRRLRLRFAVVERLLPRAGAGAPTVSGAGVGAGLARAPRPPLAAGWPLAAPAGWRGGHGSARPVLQAGGTPFGQRPLSR